MKNNLTKRSELVIGKEYYFSGVRIGRGVFAGRSVKGIYFTPTVRDGYSLATDKGWEHTVSFLPWDDLEGFEEVKD